MRRVANETAEPLSRTKRKQAAEAVTELAHQLAALPEAAFKRLPLPAELRDEFVQVRAMKASAARERQLRHLGSELREDDELLAQLRESLAGYDQASLDERRTLHRLEQWRTALIDPQQHRQTLDEIKRALPHLDVMTLEKHIDHCRARQDKAAFRAIFRLLQEATRQE